MPQTREFDYFGDRISVLDRWRMQASLNVRRQIYDWFVRQVGGVAGKTVLDFGSTPDTLRSDSNCFIRWLLEDGATVYATSPENIEGLEVIFSGLKVVSFPPKPGSLGKVDCVISSAVIEHVGCEDCQVEHFETLYQLADRILLTTPNRYHWLDFHTKLPLLHWLPKSWHRQILNGLGLTFWAKEENLNLLSETDLKQVLDRISMSQSKVSWYRPKFLGKISNLVILINTIPE
ncbi:MAG: hypothetical protein SWY16_12720 [Cyanobacteriota bacterium]|nr:hypothetical protein [Cyanobacteriota bacterium]